MSNATVPIKPPAPVEVGEVVVYRAGVGETHGGSRCQFGEPHAWQFGMTTTDDTSCSDDRVICVRCGREESDPS